MHIQNIFQLVIETSPKDPGVNCINFLINAELAGKILSQFTWLYLKVTDNSYNCDCMFKGQFSWLWLYLWVTLLIYVTFMVIIHITVTVC